MDQNDVRSTISTYARNQFHFLIWILTFHQMFCFISMRFYVLLSHVWVKISVFFYRNVLLSQILVKWFVLSVCCSIIYINELKDDCFVGLCTCRSCWLKLHLGHERSFLRSRNCSRASIGTLTWKGQWTRSPPLQFPLPWLQVLSIWL